jgi:hypothetical protein
VTWRVGNWSQDCQLLSESNQRIEDRLICPSWRRCPAWWRGAACASSCQISRPWITERHRRKRRAIAVLGKIKHRCDMRITPGFVIHGGPLGAMLRSACAGARFLNKSTRPLPAPDCCVSAIPKCQDKGQDKEKAAKKKISKHRSFRGWRI